MSALSYNSEQKGISANGSDVSRVYVSGSSATNQIVDQSEHIINAPYNTML